MHLVVLLSISAVLVTAWQLEPAREPAFVGLIRNDGMLVPFARSVEGQWRPVTAVQTTDTATALGRFSLVDPAAWPVDGWSFFAAGSTSSRPLSLLARDTTRAFCMEQDVFRTDAPVVAADSPNLIAGLAVRGSLTAVAVQAVTATSDDSSARAARTITQLAHVLEAERVAAVPPSSRLAATTSIQRQQAIVEVTTLVRARDRTADVYYFEARKPYGGFETYVNGWLSSTASSVSVMRSDSGVYMGGETVRRRGRVIGVLGGPSVRAWIMEMRAYEGASHEILEIGPTGLHQVLQVHAGGC